MSTTDAPLEEPAISTMSTALGDLDCLVVGDGPPVLVVHGSPGGHDAGLAMARFLVADGFQAIVPDRPGYFATPLSSGETPDQQADLFVGLFDALGIEKAGVLCWSGGGPSSYRLAVRHPDRLTALVSVAAVSRRYVYAGESGAEKLIMGTGFGRSVLHLMAKYTPEKLVSATIASEGDLTKEQIRQRVAQIMADPEKEKFTLDLALAANHSGPRKAGFDNDIRQFGEIDSLELDRIKAPCLLVQGTADADVDPEYSRFAAARIPGVELVELDTGTHLAFWVHPDSGPARNRAADLFRSSARQ